MIYALNFENDFLSRLIVALGSSEAKKKVQVALAVDHENDSDKSAWS